MPAARRPGGTLRFGAAVSTAPDHTAALDEVVPAALDGLGGTPDLVVCFYSAEHAPAAAGIALSLSERTGCADIIGCGARGVIGPGRELEDGPALSLWVARLPGVAVRPFALRVVPLEDEHWAVTGWPADPAPAGPTTVLLLADPFSFPSERFLEQLGAERPGVTVIGGLASGGREIGRHRLLCGTEVLSAGAVGVALSGAVEVRTVVSQGCRPVGSPYTVTRGDGNLVEELGGRPAVERLRDVLGELDPAEQAQLRSGGIQVGQVIDEARADYGRGDFLVRSLTGADPDTGAIAVGDVVRPGQTLQFHLRDERAAGDELDQLLAPVPSWGVRGALLFSCNGRGEQFFGVPDHDAGKLAAATGGAPAAGFFAAGELGPVGGRNFLHGYTASMALFCDPTDSNIHS